MKRIQLVFRLAALVLGVAQPALASPSEDSAPDVPDSSAADSAEPSPSSADETAEAAAKAETQPARSPREETPAAPNRLAPNAIYLEALGPGGLYSLNYERIFGNEWAARIGISYFAIGVSTSSGSSTASTLVLPLTASYVGLREGKHGLELGGGGALIVSSAGATIGATSSSSSGASALLTAFVGYRMHPVDKRGFQLRAGLGVDAVVGSGFGLVYPWPYVSLGFAF